MSSPETFFLNNISQINIYINIIVFSPPRIPPRALPPLIIIPSVNISPPFISREFSIFKASTPFIRNNSFSINIDILNSRENFSNIFTADKYIRYIKNARAIL